MSAGLALGRRLHHGRGAGGAEHGDDQIRDRSGPGRCCRAGRAPESNASRESLAWTRSIRPVIALTRSTMPSRSSPPAWAWQVSRQNPAPNSPIASQSRASASNRRAQALSPPAVFSIRIGSGKPPFSAA